MYAILLDTIRFKLYLETLILTQFCHQKHCQRDMETCSDPTHETRAVIPHHKRERNRDPTLETRVAIKRDTNQMQTMLWYIF